MSASCSRAAERLSMFHVLCTSHNLIHPENPRGWGYKLLIERALGASNYRTKRTVSHFQFRSFDAIVPLFQDPHPNPSSCLLLGCLWQMACDIWRKVQPKHELSCLRRRQSLKSLLFRWGGFGAAVGGLTPIYLYTQTAHPSVHPPVHPSIHPS